MPRCKFGFHAVDVDFSLVDNILENPVENRELEVWYSTLVRHYPPEKYAKLVEKIFKGFKILQERISEKNLETVFIS